MRAVGGAVCIKCVDDSAQPIRALWRRIATLENIPSMASLGYPPHFTFAIYKETDTDVLIGAVQAIASAQGPVRITFEAICRFEADPLVVWLRPRDASHLEAVHTAVHHAIAPDMCIPHYRPGAWIPHCTLGNDVQLCHRDEVTALCDAPLEPFEVVFDRLDCIAFPPVEVVREFRL